MDYLSKARYIEERALASGFLKGEAVRIKNSRPLRAIVRFSKWLRGAKVINTLITVSSTVIAYIHSYAALFIVAGASATLFAAFLLFALPVYAASYIAAGRSCAAEAKRITASGRPVRFVFLSEKLPERPFLLDTLGLFAESGEVYVVTDSISVGANGGKRRIINGVSYVHRAFYHRLKKELARAGYGGRITVVI